MQETYCCGMEIAQQAGYPHSVRASSNLSIHSRYPIIDSIKIFKPFNAHAVVIDVDEQKLLFVNTWLHYLPDSFEGIKELTPVSLIANEAPTRLKEITAIISAVIAWKRLNIPVIMGEILIRLSLRLGRKHKGISLWKVVAWPVSKLMLAHGYTDSFREAHRPYTNLRRNMGLSLPKGYHFGSD